MLQCNMLARGGYKKRAFNVLEHEITHMNQVNLATQAYTTNQGNSFFTWCNERSKRETNFSR